MISLHFAAALVSVGLLTVIYACIVACFSKEIV
jgi:hypothetical protein